LGFKVFKEFLGMIGLNFKQINKEMKEVYMCYRKSYNYPDFKDESHSRFQQYLGSKQRNHASTTLYASSRRYCMNEDSNAHHPTNP